MWLASTPGAGPRSHEQIEMAPLEPSRRRMHAKAKVPRRRRDDDDDVEAPPTLRRTSEESSDGAEDARDDDDAAEARGGDDAEDTRGGAVAAPRRSPRGPPVAAFRELDAALAALDWSRLVTRSRRNVMPEGAVEAHTVTLGVHPRDGDESSFMDIPEVRSVYDKLAALVDAYDPGFVWHSICLNKNLRCRRHRDAGNTSPSLVVGFGDYGGGRLRLWPGGDAAAAPESREVRHAFVRFDGAAQLHETEAFTGDRYVAVFYSGGPDGAWAGAATPDRLCAAPLFDPVRTAAPASLAALERALANSSGADRSAFARVLALQAAGGGDSAGGDRPAKRSRDEAAARGEEKRRRREEATRVKAEAKRADEAERRAAFDAEVAAREAEADATVVRRVEDLAAHVSTVRLLLFCPRDGVWIGGPAEDAPDRRLALVASLGSADGGGEPAGRARCTMLCRPVAAPGSAGDVAALGGAALRVTLRLVGGDAWALAGSERKRRLVAGPAAAPPPAEQVFAISAAAGAKPGLPLFVVASADGNLSTYGARPHAGVRKESTCERFLLFVRRCAPPEPPRRSTLPYAGALTQAYDPDARGDDAGALTQAYGPSEDDDA